MPRNHSHLNIFYSLVSEMLSSFPFIPRAFSAIEGVLASAMGCIFSCFGFNDNSDYSRSEEVRLNHDDQSSLFLHFLSEENPSTPTKENRVEERELDFEELKDEAQFLKAWGTILEIPAEIQEVVGEQNELSSQKGAVGSPKFKSWLTGTSVEKLDLESPPDLYPIHVTNCRELMEEVDLPHTPYSECSSPISTEVDETTKLFSSPSQSPLNPPLSSDVIAPSTVKKSVRFSCEPEMASVSARSPSETSSQTSDEPGSSRRFTYRKSSPYPTPLKIVDEMETPGTIFPAYMDMDTNGQGKHPRIRSQFVHSAVHPAESFLPCNPMNNVTRKPLVEINGCGNLGIGENSGGGEELNLEASLSPWLKGRPSNQDASMVFQDENSDVGSTPILGVVSAQFDGDESLSIIPKWRDWNGIPNTTNKYKEDQKVSWHSTPFEERLEKALSEDTFISQRRQSSSSNQQLIL